MLRKTNKNGESTTLDKTVVKIYPSMYFKQTDKENEQKQFLEKINIKC